MTTVPVVIAFVTSSRAVGVMVPIPTPREPTPPEPSASPYTVKTPFPSIPAVYASMVPFEEALVTFMSTHITDPASSSKLCCPTRSWPIVVTPVVSIENWLVPLKSEPE